jgi:hypothetical protein
MNKEFVKKIIRAEKLRYEAIKEVLPNNLRKKVETFEKDTMTIIKDIALEMMSDDLEKENTENNKKTKRVEVDFS